MLSYLTRAYSVQPLRMFKQKSFSFQILIIGGFFVFFYLFFALSTSIYRDYKLETQVQRFEDEINELAEAARVKPEDVKYYISDQYKDRYAKESLNLLNPGEKLIIIPEEERVVEQGEVRLMTELLSPTSVLNKPKRTQWWEYFFGNTLSVKAPAAPVTTNEGDEIQG